MSIITASQLKDELSDRINGLLVCHKDFIRAESALVQFDCTLSRDATELSTKIKKNAQNYFEIVAKDLTSSHNEGTHATIESDIAWTDFKENSNLDIVSHRFSTAMYMTPAEFIDKATDWVALNGYVELYLNDIDYQMIASNINQQVEALAQNGRSEFANYLAAVIGIKYNGYMPLEAKGYFAEKQMTVCSYFDSFKYKESYCKIQECLDDISQYTGVSLGRPFSALSSECEKMTYEKQYIEPRTKLGDIKSDPIAIECFKSKYKLRINHKALEAIAAYMSAFANNEYADKLLELINCKQIA
jgi:hypothetical protein